MVFKIIFENRVGPDAMPHSAAFHLDLLCLKKYMYLFWASSIHRDPFISMSKYDKVACLSNENLDQLGYLSSFISLPLALWEASKPIVSSDRQQRLIGLDGSTGSFESMLATQAD